MLNKVLLIFAILVCLRCGDDKCSIYFGEIEPDAIPIIFGANTISQKGRLEHGISFSPDNKELLFGVLSKTSETGSIHFAKKNNNDWTKPELFKPLEGESVFLPYFTPDGRSVLFAKSKSEVDNGNSNIGLLTKINDKWQLSEKKMTSINSISREANASMTNDGAIYFSSNRNCLGQENCYTADLFYAKSNGGEYLNAEELFDLNSSVDEESVFISPKEDYMLFCRFTDMKSWMDLYISYQDKYNKWTKPKILDASINSKDWDRRPFVSFDNTYLFFTRLQIGETGLTESDIYWVNTTKVFSPFVYHSPGQIKLEVGKGFHVKIPADYFKDIDDNDLKIDIEDNSLDWLQYNAETMIMSGSAVSAGSYDVVFTATDNFFNTTNDTIILFVKK